MLLGCGNKTTSEKKFAELGKVFPSTVTFKNQFVNPTPKPVVLNTTVKVTIKNQEAFIKDVVAKLYDSVKTDDLAQVMHMGFQNLGIPVDSTVVPDSLRNWYNAWIVSMSALAYAAQDQDKLLSKIGLDGVIDDGKPATSQEMTSMSSTLPNDYGEVTLETSFDYDHAPKGLIEID